MKFKKAFFIKLLIIAAVGVAGLIALLARRQAPAQDTRLKVVTSGYVAFAVAREIGGEKINLSMLLPANAEPHSFEPTPGTIIAVHSAGVFIYVSPQLEPWVKDILSSVRPGVAVVEAANGAAPSKDPHIWMDFDNMRPFARAVSAALSEQDPANRAFFEERLALFLKELDELDAEYSRVLSACQTREMVHIGHLAFGNLAARYRLHLTALAGTSHDGEHSVRKLAGVIKQVRQSGVKYVFTEEEIAQNLAATVARETGAQVLPLYTVEHVSRQDVAAHTTYAQFMHRNLTNLARGLQCKA